MSRGRRIDFGDRNWTAHAQDHWLDHAGNPNLPDYLRIVFVAYGRHRANGHARLDRGELAYFLVRADGTLPDRRQVRHCIDRAIDYGFLLPESRALCLVVSSDHIQGGIGDAHRPCDRDHTTRSLPRKDVAERSRSARKDVATTGRSPAKDVAERSRSRLNPSLSSIPPTERAAGSRPCTTNHRPAEAS